jgi:nicotinate-nucleotide adenylyltransferase
LIYGGSFDPVHQGHLKTALSVQDMFQFKRFIFVPCKGPVLKEATVASAQQRLDMLSIALNDYPYFEIDSREIQRSTPSFMTETLESFRSEWGDDTSLTLLIGKDAFISLPEWHCWENILKQCNLLVMQRETTDHKPMPDIIKQLLIKHEVFDHPLLLNSGHGVIVRLNAGHYPISSSEIRKEIRAGHCIQHLVPEKVYEYIKAQGLYSSHQ